MAESSAKRFKKGHSFNSVHTRVMEHKDDILVALPELDNPTWICFCFVKIIHCNAAYGCSFSNAWCVTRRNIQESDRNQRQIATFTSLFNVGIIKQFFEKKDDIESTMTDNQLTAFERLASFLSNELEDPKKITSGSTENYKEESAWAAVLGTHVLNKLAGSNVILFDNGYSGRIKECPCGCRTVLNVGDTSIGNKEVWHGSLDILLGPVAVICTETFNVGTTLAKMEERESSSSFELKTTGELEDSRPQIIAQTIVGGYVQQTGLVPTIAVSKTACKVFMYDKKYDLLYEGTELPLFDTRGNLHGSTLLVLWFAINHEQFCTGVKASHEELGYVTGFKSFLEGTALSIYEHKMARCGCKQAKSSQKLDKFQGINVFDCKVLT